MTLFSPVGQALLRKLAGAPSLADVSIERFTVGEPETVQRREALSLPGELQKVTGFAPFRTMDLEMARLRPGELVLRACTAYVLDDALVVDGNVYKSRAKHLVTGSTRTLAAWVDDRLDAGVLAANRQSHLYFGHWMTEELPATWAGQRQGRMVTTHHGRRPYSHEAGYLRLYDMPPPAELPARCRVQRLTVLGDHGMNTMQLRGIAELKASLRSRGWQAGASRVFIRRGGGSPRRLTNEAELTAELEAQGFTIVDQEHLTAEQIAHACFDAELVVGVEGSHLAHAVLQMKPGATLLVIQPPDRFNNPFKDLCDALDMRYGYLVADPEGVGFHQSPGALMTLLHAVAA